MVTRAIRRNSTGMESSDVDDPHHDGVDPAAEEAGQARRRAPRRRWPRRPRRSPTMSEAWPPYMRRPRMSKPVPSVPRGWPLPGGAF